MTIPQWQFKYIIEIRILTYILKCINNIHVAAMNGDELFTKES